MKTHGLFFLRLPALALLLGLGLVLAACGDTATATPPPPTAMPVPPTTAATPAAGGGGSAAPIEIKLSEWSIDPKDLTVPAGKVTFHVTDGGKFTHDFAVMSNGTEIARSDKIGGGADTTFTVDLQAGTYQTLCDIPGHKAQGMQGTLTVK